THAVMLLEGIIRQFDAGIDCYAMNGLSAEHLDEEIIDLLVKANFKLLNISLATVSAEQLQNLQRHTDVSHFGKIARYAGQRGLKIIGHFIAGLPGQSLSEILASMRFLAELPLILGISPFYYIPGMELTPPRIPPSCKEARLTRFFPADDLLNERDLITLFRLSRWINYLKEQLRHHVLPSLVFNDIPSIFPDDPFLRSFAEDGKIIGVDAQNNIYTHDISDSVIRSFKALFRDAIIYCA
ncbi:MAG: radical SAM protein, partial [FCB group bacterium]|nr:radical SAM protein [FCB group bacterium]